MRGYLKYKYNKIPAYDLANKISSGYQFGDSFNQGQETITQGDDISGDIATTNGSILPQAASKIGTYTSLLGSGLKSGFSAMNAAKAAATKAGQEFSRQAANQAYRKGLGTMGNIAGVAGAAMGTYDMLNTIGNMKNNVASTQDLQSRTSTFTNNIGGFTYDGYGGLNSQNEIDLLKAKNHASKLNSTLSGAGAGASIGSLIGPWGSAIGAGIGAVTGFIGSLFGASGTKQKLYDRMNKLALAQSNYNNQSFSDAATKNIQNEFAQSHSQSDGLYNADYGLDLSSLVGNGSAGYGKVFDADGEHYGERKGRIGKGESVVNLAEGKAAYVDKGVKRADDQYTSVEQGDDNIILGNDVDWETGQSFADQAAPYSKYVQHLNNIEKRVQNSKGSKETKELNQKQLKLAKEEPMNKLKELGKKQDMQHKITGSIPGYSDRGMDGYIPTYDRGLSPYITTIPYLMSIPMANRQYNMYKNSTPMAESSYAPNMASSAALEQMANIKANPYEAINSNRQNYRHSLYNLMQNGGITAGQRMAQQAALNNNYMQTNAAIYNQANEQNNKYRQQYAAALMNAGSEDAKMRQQSNQLRNEQNAASHATRLRGMESGIQSRINMLSALAGNLFNIQQAKSTEKQQEFMRNLYDRQIKLNEYLAGMRPNSNNKIQYQSPIIENETIPYIENLGPLSPEKYGITKTREQLPIYGTSLKGNINKTGYDMWEDAGSMYNWSPFKQNNIW